MGLDNPLHIAFLLVILLLVFGAKRLPEMGRSLGEGLRGFRDTISGEGGSHHVAATESSSETPPASTATVLHTEPQAIAAAPAQAVVHAPATEDPEVIATAWTPGPRRSVDSDEAGIEHEPELLHN
ncbi:MAG: twin-arginine translocase TatA/TatE family subunit [Solirubrobacteraceae bacterium]